MQISVNPSANAVNIEDVNVQLGLVSHRRLHERIYFI